MRFYGEVGYGTTVEDPPGSGKYVDHVVEQPYFGDVIRNTSERTEGSSVNDDISVGNSISIVADQYATDNIKNIKYVRWGGEAWKVTSVEVRAPRLILSLGVVYNGPTA